MAAPLIEVRGLRFRYPGGAAALDGVDFTLYSGESVSLFGGNGSGKTTFVLHLNGLLRAVEGEIRIGGAVLNRRTLPEIRRKVGLVFQDADDQLFLPTILDDVRFGPLNAGLSEDAATEAATRALRQAGLHEGYERAPYHLSAGEKRRVAIAGVLATSPEILVLDEPTTSLDPPGRRDLIRLLNALPQAKIIVTHDVAFARATTKRAAFFRHGRIAGDGTVEDMVRAFDWD